MFVDQLYDLIARYNEVINETDPHQKVQPFYLSLSWMMKQYTC